MSINKKIKLFYWLSISFVIIAIILFSIRLIFIVLGVE